MPLSEQQMVMLQQSFCGKDYDVSFTSAGSMRQVTKRLNKVGYTFSIKRFVFPSRQSTPMRLFHGADIVYASFISPSRRMAFILLRPRASIKIGSALAAGISVLEIHPSLVICSTILSQQDTVEQRSQPINELSTKQTDSALQCAKFAWVRRVHAVAGAMVRLVRSKTAPARPSAGCTPRGRHRESSTAPSSLNTATLRCVHRAERKEIPRRSGTTIALAPAYAAGPTASGHLSRDETGTRRLGAHSVSRVPTRLSPSVRGWHLKGSRRDPAPR